jgi:hypothetical protein
MSTTHQRFTARIAGSPETIFDLIAGVRQRAANRQAGRPLLRTRESQIPPLRSGSAIRERIRLVVITTSMLIIGTLTILLFGFDLSSGNRSNRLHR